MAKDTILKFPCEFPIKIVGKNDVAFQGVALTILRKHVPDLGEGAIQIRDSKDGTYLALTATITATSKRQLDAIYQDLSDEALVIMAL